MLMRDFKIIKNGITYEWNSENADTNHFAITEQQFDSDLNVAVTPNSLTRGGLVGKTLGAPRLFHFKGQLFGDRVSLNIGIQKLQRVINLGLDGGDEYFKIEFRLNGSTTVYNADVKVYDGLKIRDTESDTIKDFEFTLISPTFSYWVKDPQSFIQSYTGVPASKSFQITPPITCTEVSPLKLAVRCSNGFSALTILNGSGKFVLTRTTAPNTWVNFDFTGKTPVVIVGASTPHGTDGLHAELFRGQGSTALFINPGIPNNFNVVIEGGSIGNLDVNLEYYQQVT